MTHKVEYITHMGNDDFIANVARVSYDKWNKSNNVDNAKLLSYLAKHNHFTPFAHPQITLRVTCPIFVRTQLFKHKVGFVENEVSRRYITSLPKFSTPENLREKPINSKQGSGNNLPESINYRLLGLMREHNSKSLELYEELIYSNVCPEQARGVLPQNTLTSFIWTGSLYAYARMCNLRLKSDTQLETREVANDISKILEPIFPISWSLLIDNEKQK
jgi:thymidylate synthase (FAD)